MAKQGANDISWADFTFNLWEGCFKISPGCKHCYAEAMNTWLRKGENWGIDAPRKSGDISLGSSNLKTLPNYVAQSSRGLKGCYLRASVQGHPTSTIRRRFMG